MKLILIFILLMPITSFSKEVKWDLLRKLKIVRSKGKVTKINTPKEVKNVLGKSISIKGFMLPLDYESKEISEFLLVPYMPSCAHVPPPPANQVIHVKMKKGSKAKPSYYPISVDGKINVLKSKNEFMEASYMMTATKIKELK